MYFEVSNKDVAVKPINLKEVTTRGEDKQCRGYAAAYATASSCADCARPDTMSLSTDTQIQTDPYAN